MKRQLVVVWMLLGMACAARAQEATPDATSVARNVAAEYSPAPEASATLFEVSPASTFFPTAHFAVSPTVSSSDYAFDASPAPAPAPAPDPKFLYGGRDDYRWQVGIGVDWLRFNSSIFNASAVGVKTSLTYFTNDWFGIEGNVSAAFAPEILVREHIKLLVYGVGPKIAWRERQWEPWLHAIVSGSHEQPQTEDNSKNAFALQVGGGADYRFNPRFSGRLEADWIRSQYFAQAQNNFELMGGLVFHF
jgi:hypothetical protein